MERKPSPSRRDDRTVKNAFVLVFMVLSQVFGDLWLSQGMKVFGEVNVISPQILLGLVVYLVTSPWIVLGVGTLILSLLFYLVAVSRLDLSFVLPIHASGYVFNALFAWIVLGEHVSNIRWLATFIVTIGVLLVSWNQNKQTAPVTSDPWVNRKPVPALLFLFTVTPYLSKIWLGVLILVLADAAGDIFLARGMKQVGRVSLKSFSELGKLARRIITNTSVLRGIGAQAIAFFTFLCLLSWADVSYVRPITSLTYAASLLGARYILKERVVPGRLMGMIAIGIGVSMVALT
jgi:bacterial/archaeal transporter family protein